MRNSKLFSKPACILLASLLISLTLTGCMPYRELKNESIVEGMGIDYKDGQYLITFQIYNPQQSGGGDGDNTKKSSGPNTVKILQSTGNSLFDAVRNATLQTGRKLFFSNIRAYIIGRDICKSHFCELLDFMQRNQQIKPTERIFISKGKAEDILTYQQDGTIEPALNIQQMAENYSDTSKILDMRLLDIFKYTASGMVDPAVSLISINKLNGKNVLQMSGTAVIHNNKLEGFLDYAQTRGLMWITGKCKGGVFVVEYPKCGSVTIEILSASSSMNISESGGKPVINISVTAKTSIDEIHSYKKCVINYNFETEVSKLQNEAIKKEINDALNQSIDIYGADIFGFRQKIFQQKPELWRKISGDWDNILKHLDIRINVKSEVENAGLTNIPTYPKSPVK